MKFNILVVLDTQIGRFICFFFSLMTKIRKRPVPRSVETVMVTKLRGIGDLVLALPMIKAIHQNGKRVILLGGTKNIPIVRNQPYIDKIFSFDVEKISDSIKAFSVLRRIRKEHVDACVDLTQSANYSTLLNYLSRAGIRIGFRNDNMQKKAKNRMYTHLIPFNNHQHIIKSYFDLVRPLQIKEPADLDLERLVSLPKDRSHVKKFISSHRLAGKRVAGVHLSSPVKAKRWPFKSWAEVIDYLLANDFHVVAIGVKKEKSTINRIIPLLKKETSRFVNAAGLFSLPQLFAVMDHFDIFLSNDGGPMHIASAQGKPLIALFGPETPVRYGALSHSSYSLYKGDQMQCSPCSKPYMGSWPRCRKPFCLEAITSAEVIATIDEMMNTLYGQEKDDHNRPNAA